MPAGKNVYARQRIYSRSEPCRRLKIPRNELYSFTALPRRLYGGCVAFEQTKVFEAAEEFARVEGILPAPESSHAIRAAIDEALKCKETGEEKTIVFGLTGTGYFDMVAYEKFHDGKMDDYIPTDAELKESISKLPKVE